MRGKRGECGYKHIGHGDHPRRCGENYICLIMQIVFSGSPPQVRGKPKHRPEVDPCLRITPAGAGKTLHGGASSMRTRDHPRRCGENSLNSSSCRRRSGSPPQVRGKQYGIHTIRLSGRITPAGAGKTEISSTSAKCLRDHPRRCGENFLRNLTNCKQKGSPPQVRGKLKQGITEQIDAGITPAGAGKTVEHDEYNTPN